MYRIGGWRSLYLAEELNSLKQSQRRITAPDLRTKISARMKRTSAPNPLRREKSTKRLPFATLRASGAIQSARDQRVMTSIKSVGSSVTKKILPFCLLSQTVRPRSVNAARSWLLVPKRDQTKAQVGTGLLSPN